MSEIEISGGCHCGHVRYTALVDTQKTRICHCQDCQILSGSAFRVNLPVSGDNFHLLIGELTLYYKNAASGARRAQCFCPLCGTQIYATSDEAEPSVYNLRVGTVDQRELLAPKRQQWKSSAVNWLNEIEDIKCYQFNFEKNEG